jgi:YHS domain-containing protein
MQESPSASKTCFTTCGGKISDPDQYPSAEFHGERVYFCTRACLRAYLGDPERFMAGEIEHPEDDET